MDFSSSSFYRSFIRMPIWVMEKLARSTGRSDRSSPPRPNSSTASPRATKATFGGDELKALRKLAGEMLMLDANALAAAVKNATIMEIEYHG
jgi:hypothetical protein